ncbi:MAG: type II toxin-antitoxin system RatA family toxin [Candidatus Rokuibacteriota bacterium]
MPVVESAIEIAAPRDKLFALAQDYGLRLRWDPFLREMRFRGGAGRAAVGVRVRVKARNGLTMEVEYVTFQPPEQVAMKMIHGPFFFEHFAGSWRFKASGSDRTTVTFRYVFSTRFRLVRPLLDAIVKGVLLYDVRARLRGLKTCAETTDALGALP